MSTHRKQISPVFAVIRRLARKTSACRVTIRGGLKESASAVDWFPAENQRLPGHDPEAGNEIEINLSPRSVGAWKRRQVNQCEIPPHAGENRPAEAYPCVVDSRSGRGEKSENEQF